MSPGERHARQEICRDMTISIRMRVRRLPKYLSRFHGCARRAGADDERRLRRRRGIFTARRREDITLHCRYFNIYIIAI